MVNENSILEVAANFTPNPTKGSLLGAGLIHQTYLVESPTEKIVLQKVNTQVFPNAPLVVSNHVAIHKQVPSITVAPLLARNGDYLVTEEEALWRALEFRIDSISLTSFTEGQAESAAQLFASYSNDLSNSGISLQATIVNFHDPANRYFQLENRIKSSADAQAVKAFRALSQFSDLLQLLPKVEQLPTRVTHSDTKIDNILFKEDGTATTVIDLDTTMAGKIIYDFGDMIRTTAVNINESSTEREIMQLNLSVVKAIVRGYLRGYGSMTAEEKELLVAGALLIAFEQSTRFLLDNLAGNIYYKTEYESQNLDRALNQLQLLGLLAEHQAEIESFVKG